VLMLCLVVLNEGLRHDSNTGDATNPTTDPKHR
jgi:hypothetical protein